MTRKRKTKMNAICLYAALSLVMIVGRVSAQECDSLTENPISRIISSDRIVLPYELKVTFDKTVHVIFPSSVRYIDLGSNNIIAGKAGDAGNVVRVKAAVKNFEERTNFSVITEDGSFYSFNVVYAAEPEMLNIEMKDFLGDNGYADATNTMDVNLDELGEESPRMVYLTMRSIFYRNKKKINYIGSRRFGVQYTLRSIYSHEDLLFFNIETKNNSAVPFVVDFVTFKIVDKKVAKRTAIQERKLQPIRTFNEVTRIGGRTSEHTVFVLKRFTIPDDKVLIVSMFEKDGGRNQQFTVKNSDIIRATDIKALKTD